jgi:hypothetical protein
VEGRFIVTLGWPRSCRTRFEGPAEERGVRGMVEEGEEDSLAIVSEGPWPIGDSSSTSLYHRKSADDAAILRGSVQGCGSVRGVEASKGVGSV